jgi:hypothetical protein
MRVIAIPPTLERNNASERQQRCDDHAAVTHRSNRKVEVGRAVRRVPRGAAAELNRLTGRCSDRKLDVSA